MEKIIKLPSGAKVDAFNLPENFDEIIKKRSVNTQKELQRIIVSVINSVSSTM